MLARVTNRCLREDSVEDLEPLMQTSGFGFLAHKFVISFHQVWAAMQLYVEQTKANIACPSTWAMIRHLGSFMFSPIMIQGGGAIIGTKNKRTARRRSPTYLFFSAAEE